MSWQSSNRLRRRRNAASSACVEGPSTMSILLALLAPVVDQQPIVRQIPGLRWRCGSWARSIEATRSGSSGLPTSNTCRPSKPGETVPPPQELPARPVFEFHDLTRMSPHTSTSPWFPRTSRVAVRVVHDLDRIVGLGDVDDPNPRTCLGTPFPQNARSELKTPCPATEVTRGTIERSSPSRHVLRVREVPTASPTGSARRSSRTEQDERGRGRYCDPGTRCHATPPVARCVLRGKAAAVP